MRSLEERQPILAAVYYQHVNAPRTQLVHQALDQHEPLSAERLQQQAEASSGRSAANKHESPE